MNTLQQKKVRQLEMREGYETKVATLLSLGFDASVDECYNALVSSAGNMERAVEILLENQSQRGTGEQDASTPLIEVEEEEEEELEEVKEEEEDEEEEKEEDEENEETEQENYDENALFGDVVILVPGVDFTSAATLKALLGL